MVIDKIDDHHFILNLENRGTAIRKLIFMKNEISEYGRTNLLINLILLSFFYNFIIVVICN